MATIQAKICNLLGFDPKRHNWKTEVLAGITSFLTMSYILAVNPSMFGILEGMPQGAVFTTTALVALISTLLVAFVARMPFGIAPGMGPNAFFVFTVCISMKYSWQFALTVVQCRFGDTVVACNCLGIDSAFQLLDGFHHLTFCVYLSFHRHNLMIFV